ncbi:hypothetical protein LIER_19320 [Lithospermum erythrorhizon]|uniref:Phytocyanin domain-containing protein n=1 Tax=Lithospermum erythrorhizon TaxID=34254 RepID=A0AAV3QHA9_LITER
MVQHGIHSISTLPKPVNHAYFVTLSCPLFNMQPACMQNSYHIFLKFMQQYLPSPQCKQQTPSQLIIKIKPTMNLVKMEELLCVFLILTSLFGTSISTFYIVGDSAGWTTTSNIDYQIWTSTKNFVVGDTLLFQYDNHLHNVLVVQREDYHSCNMYAPIATYASGNDSFTIGNHGHFFFICGVPGHCEAGQRLDIRVLRVPPQTSATPEMVVPTRVSPTSASSLDAAASSGSIALASYAESSAGAFAFCRLQIVLSFIFVYCFLGVLISKLNLTSTMAQNAATMGQDKFLSYGSQDIS